MANMNMIEAIRSAHDVMMERDPTVVVLGEDVGYFGGVFRCTDGLQKKYGEHRVIDAPIAEGGIIGSAIGIGVNGLRPVAEIVPTASGWTTAAIDPATPRLSRICCGFCPIAAATPAAAPMVPRIAVGWNPAE